MAANVGNGLSIHFIILQICVLNVVHSAVSDEETADLNEEDWKTLGFNLVVLKDQIDTGFEPDGQPINIEGTYHTATLQKYTKDKQCFQLLTIECDMIQKGTMKDSVKISCSITVSPDMKSTGIKIGNIITELSPGRFLFVIQGGSCHRRVYLTLSRMVMNRKIDDYNCKRYTQSEKEDRARGVIAMLSENVPIFLPKNDKAKYGKEDKIENKEKNTVAIHDKSKENINEKDKSKVKIKDKSKEKAKTKENLRYDDENMS